MTSLELRIPPALLVLIAAALMAWLSFEFPALRAVLPGRVLLSTGLVALGVAVAVAGVLEFRRERTTVNPLAPDRATSLVTTGIYRFSRNPMYLGFLLALFGWAIYLGNLLALAVLPAFVAYMNRFQIEPEERALARIFGARFDAYAASVRRWL